MNICVCLTGISPAPWVISLRKALPDCSVTVWEPGAGLADYAVVWQPPQQFIDEQCNLQALFSIGAGVDAILQLQLPENLKVIRLDDAGMAVQMAEYVCHAVIGYFRDLNHRADVWSYRKTRDRNDFTVGIMGAGVLGQRVIKTLQMFEYPINVYSRTVKEITGADCFSGVQGLFKFLSKTDILVNLLPLTAKTENILNYDTLSQLPSGAYVINAARGAHLVEQDLISLIDSGHISGATLDVFRTEPLPDSHAFWHHPKITVTPHTAARILRGESIEQIVSKILCLEQNKSVTGIVNRQLGY